MKLTLEHGNLKAVIWLEPADLLCLRVYLSPGLEHLEKEITTLLVESKWHRHDGTQIHTPDAAEPYSILFVRESKADYPPRIVNKALTLTSQEVIWMFLNLHKKPEVQATKFSDKTEPLLHE